MKLNWILKNCLISRNQISRLAVVTFPWPDLKFGINCLGIKAILYTIRSKNNWTINHEQFLKHVLWISEENSCRRWKWRSRRWRCRLSVNTAFPLLWDVWMTESLISSPSPFHLSCTHHSVTTACLVSLHINLCRAAVLTTVTTSRLSRSVQTAGLLFLSLC